MAHPDHETRVGAHRVLSAVLVPSFVFPWPVPLSTSSPKVCDRRRTLSVSLSGFSSSASITGKVVNRSFSAREALRERKHEPDSSDQWMREHMEHKNFDAGSKNENIDTWLYTVNPSDNLPQYSKLLCSQTDGRTVTESKLVCTTGWLP